MLGGKRHAFVRSARKSGAGQDLSQGVRLRPQQLGVEAKAVGQPSPNVVARRASALDRFVVATSGAKVTCPSTATGRLLLEMAAIEPTGLPISIHAAEYIAHETIIVIDETMAGIQSTVRRNAHVSTSGTAGILFPLIRMNALKCLDDV